MRVMVVVRGRLDSDRRLVRGVRRCCARDLARRRHHWTHQQDQHHDGCAKSRHPGSIRHARLAGYHDDPFEHVHAARKREFAGRLWRQTHGDALSER